MSFGNKKRLLEILLVEDNPGDARLIKEIYKESKIIKKIHVVEDGVEAIAYLTKKGDFKNRKRPDLILLDLNLPKKDGREVLAEIKENSSLKQIPAVVFTSSKAERDIVKSYENYANCYITKPVGINQFIKVLKAIENFWFSMVELPPNKNFAE